MRFSNLRKKEFKKEVQKSKGRTTQPQLSKLAGSAMAGSRVTELSLGHWLLGLEIFVIL